jgi:rubrerythrin
LESAITEAEADAAAYDTYAAAARKDRLADVADWFESVAAAERVHASQLRRVMSSTADG